MVFSAIFQPLEFQSHVFFNWHEFIFHAKLCSCFDEIKDLEKESFHIVRQISISRRIFTKVFLIAPLTLAASITSANSNASFQTPSGNIVCFAQFHSSTPYSPSGITCLVFENEWQRPAANDCEFDESYDGVTIPKEGEAEFMRSCHNDPWWPYPNATLGYGSTWVLDDFSCLVKTDGVHCMNGQQNGFHIRRSKAILF